MTLICELIFAETKKYNQSNRKSIMFTLKFYKPVGDDGDMSYDVIGCPHYEVFERVLGVKTITVYKDLFNTEGVERHIAGGGYGEQKNYSVCYIENSTGKTIDTIRPGFNCT